MKATVLGRRGFIGSALTKKLESLGIKVYPYPRKDVDVVYCFGAPSSQTIFKHAPTFNYLETLNTFLNVLGFCKQNNIQMVYPSSATVYNPVTEYAQCKASLEYFHDHQDYENIIGFRIFAGYGNEENKGEYASIIYQFCKQMKKGKSPVIWGNGEQKRDFVYIDDIVDTIITNTNRRGIMDIGTGKSYSFNEIVATINKVLGTDIKPIYIDKPENYINETICNNPIKAFWSLENGIREICKNLP